MIVGGYTDEIGEVVRVVRLGGLEHSGETQGCGVGAAPSVYAHSFWFFWGHV